METQEPRSRRAPWVYLAGPITGRTPEEIFGWRRRAGARLSPYVSVWDPTDYAIDPARAGAGDRSTEPERLAHGRAAVWRNREAVLGSELVLANCAGVTDPSVGTIGEIFWADAAGIPVVLVRDPRSVYDHSMLTALASRVFDDLDEALRHVVEERLAGRQRLP